MIVACLNMSLVEYAISDLTLLGLRLKAIDGSEPFFSKPEMFLERQFPGVHCRTLALIGNAKLDLDLSTPGIIKEQRKIE